MMKIKICIFWIVFAIIVAGCTKSEIDENLLVVERVLFTAYTESSDSITKLTLTGEVGDDSRKVFWDIKDQIGIITEEGSEFSKFTNINIEQSNLGLFEGEIGKSDYYYAFFPWSDNLKKSGSVISFGLPGIQIYKPNSFGSECSPMVSRKELDNDFSFKNLCGVLALRIKGNFRVRSITFTAKDESGKPMPVSGGAQVDMAYIRTPELVMSDNANTGVVLYCEGEGVPLSETESTSFHIVLPVAEYNTFNIEIKSTDGRTFVKEGIVPLTIKRSIATKTGEFVPEVVELSIDAVNLSAIGTANSYIVSSIAKYMIDASIIGNGYPGIVPNAGFHTNIVEINPVSAKLLWEENGPLLTDVEYHSEDKFITFNTTGNKGNAVIAACDENDNILWSWHIWCTDQPKNHKYVNELGTFYVLDRNIGALRADGGTTEQERQESIGTLYFWGRKDPFNGENHDRSGKARLSIEETISNPLIIHSTGSWADQSSWMQEHNDYMWSDEYKTINDPCPIGYKVASNIIWSGLTTTSQRSEDVSEFNVSGTFNKGWNFYTDETRSTTAWYPAPYIYDWNGYYRDISEYGAWASNYRDFSCNQYALQFSSNVIDPFVLIGNGYGLPVRCMKDGEHLQISLSNVSIKAINDITENSATIIVDVMGDGVVDKGILIGTESNVTLEGGIVYARGEGAGEFSVDIEDLKSFTKYYVKAYAINEYGTSYSSVMNFTTDYDGEVVNLSQDGTANCYVVSQPGAYCFDASIIGNGETGIISDAGFHTTTSSIDPASVELLWEDKIGLILNTSYDPVNKAIAFLTDGTEGNAVIVAKNEEGAIIWSWHIWCTDQPQEITFNSEVLMDRNIGAITAKVSNEDEAGMATGLFYQWGRKDPFDYNLDVWSKGDTFSSIEESINNPTVYSPGDAWLGADNNKLWGGKKTIYDPCPAGWRVVNYSTWTYFSTEECDDYGAYLTGEEGNRYWFPYHDRTNNLGNYQIMGKRGELWTNQCRGIISYTGSNFSYYDRCTSDSYPVRCQKDE